MNGPVPIREGMLWVGVNDRETDLFEGLWPVPAGISYNATLILDEKIALIDAVGSAFLPELLEKLRAVLPPGRAPDYLVINHVEPDHAGATALLLSLFPSLRIVGNARTLDLLGAFQGITDRTLRLADREVLELGRHRLRAILTPMVHWPETMMTFEERERVLFTGDVFGSFGALGGGISDTSADPARLEAETLRYFANVLGCYSGMIRKALARVAEADPALLVPSHGPVWERGPALVRAWYDRWSRFAADEGAVVAYASMYRNTKRMAECVAEGLAESGVTSVALHDVSRSHPSFILADIWRYAAVALGTPTYNTSVFPAMAHLLSLVRDKGIVGRTLGLFGSFGWSGGGMAALRDFATQTGWPVVEPVVETRGAPGAGALDECRRLGRNLAAALHLQEGEDR
jgi:flavorubredoxin